MTVSKPQAQMLATLACDARPIGARQWDPDAVMAEIAKLADRSLGAVACAVIRAAMDRGAERPAVISSAGSHWADTMVAAPFVPHTLDAGQRCSICSHSEDVCRMRWAGDHEFLSAAEAAKRAVSIDAERTAALKAELAPTSGPTARRTLEDLAEANPTLHARVEAVRAANPGLQAPPMQEPLRDPEPDQPDTEPDEPQEAV